MQQFLFPNGIAMTFPHWIPIDIGRVSPEEQEEAEGVCFICGCDAVPDEPMIVISRSWMTPDSDEVLDSLVSLQACLSCSFFENPGISGWVYRPKLTGAERMGFEFYSRLIFEFLHKRSRQIGALPEPAVPDSWNEMPHYSLDLDMNNLKGGKLCGFPLGILSSEQCLHCRKMVNTKRPHMLVEIALETCTSHEVFTHDVLSIGSYCNLCSKELFPVNENGFTSKLAKDMFER